LQNTLTKEEEVKEKLLNAQVQYVASQLAGNRWENGLQGINI
jgi:hypothetical protein